jgi:protein-tyrosine phosphatase
MNEGLFTVLMVCTGNIGRSPMMERLMRRELVVRQRSDATPVTVTVTSAGTLAQLGRPMEPGAQHALTDLGVDADDFGATPLTSAAVTSSDLILVATRDHRSAVVGLLPAAVRRTFTLLELARIAESAPPRPGAVPDASLTLTSQGLRDAVAWAAQVRGSVPRPERDDADDLADPLGEPDGVYRQRAATVAVSVERIVRYLLGSTSAG